MIEAWPWYIRHLGEIEQFTNRSSVHAGATASEALEAMGRGGGVGSVRDVEYGLYQLVQTHRE